MRRMAAINCCISSRLRPAEGSSSIRSLGSPTSARAISRIRRWPAGSVRAGRSPARPKSPATRSANVRIRRISPRACGSREQVLDHAGSRELAGADHDVFEHRHALENLRRLERAHHSSAVAVLHRLRGQRLAAEFDRAGLQGQITADDVEQRGLAGAVRSDQSDQSALGNRQRDAAQHGEAAEPVADAIEREDVAAHAPTRDQPSLPAACRSRPTRPSGSSTTTATSARPNRI